MLFQIPVKNNFISRICLHAIPFAFSFTNFTHFQLLRSASYLPTHFSEDVHMLVIQMILLLESALYPGIPQPPNFFKFAYIKVCSFCCKVLWTLISNLASNLFLYYNLFHSTEMTLIHTQNICK